MRGSACDDPKSGPGISYPGVELPTVRVACLQLKARELDEAPEALDDALAAIDLAAGEGAQIVVLPEMTYPAYFLYSRAAYANAAGSESAVLSSFGAAARRHGIVVAVGLGTTQGAELFNSAVLFGPDGVEIGRYAKSFLWHFDRAWFTPGDVYPVFDTPFGRVGILVCADSRAPEIARAMAIQGAQIILDPTAWVSGGRSAEALYTPQTDYLMPTRAIENGLPVAAATKWGPEAGTIIYSGRSRIIAADGMTLAEGPTEGDSCVVADVQIDSPQPPVVRRPELYGDIARPADELPIARLVSERLSMDTPAPRIVVAQLKKPARAGEFLDSARRIAMPAARQDARLILFPDASAALDEKSVQALGDLSVDAGEVLLGFTIRAGPPGARRRRFVLFSSGAAVLQYDQAHLSKGDLAAGFEPGPALSPVLQTVAGRLAVMVGDEGLVPEVARCLMLAGADLLLWPAAGASYPLLTIARSRADENRTYVALAGHAGGAGAALIAPGAAVIATVPLSMELAAGGAAHAALARWKELAPGTNIIHSRIPASYGALLEG